MHGIEFLESLISAAMKCNHYCNSCPIFVYSTGPPKHVIGCIPRYQLTLNLGGIGLQAHEITITLLVPSTGTICVTLHFIAIGELSIRKGWTSVAGIAFKFALSNSLTP